MQVQGSRALGSGGVVNSVDLGKSGVRCRCSEYVLYCAVCIRTRSCGVWVGSASGRPASWMADGSLRTDSQAGRSTIAFSITPLPVYVYCIADVYITSGSAHATVGPCYRTRIGIRKHLPTRTRCAHAVASYLLISSSVRLADTVIGLRVAGPTAKALDWVWRGGT